MTVDLRTKLGHVELPNPIMTASGCAGAGRELAQFMDVSKIGAIVTKSVMLAPRSGRPTPRMAETPSGMLNSIGLQGPGVDAFLQRDLPWLLSRGARAVVSIAGGTVAEYAELARSTGFYDPKNIVSTHHHDDEFPEPWEGQRRTMTPMVKRSS